MKSEKYSIVTLFFTLLSFGCGQKVEENNSQFKVAKDYYEFSKKMENNDTLNIGVNLSMCVWREYDRLQITKKDSNIFLKLKEKRVMNDKPLTFSKVVYNLKSDSINLEKMMSSFDINYQEKSASPFFIIINPKEKDTILLRTNGLSNRGSYIRKYKKIMSKLYPKEMQKYENETIEIIENDIK